MTHHTDPTKIGLTGFNCLSVHGGDTWNVIPQELMLRGTVRSFDAGVKDRLRRRYPATVNTPAQTCHALAATTALVGADNVDSEPTPSMAPEDFTFMLQAKPGWYIRLGGGQGSQTPILHNACDDFNGDALAIGASYWVTLAEAPLPVRAHAREATPVA